MIIPGDIIKVYWSDNDIKGTDILPGWYKGIVLNTMKNDKYSLLYDEDLQFTIITEHLPISNMRHIKFNHPRSGDWIIYKPKHNGLKSKTVPNNKDIIEIDSSLIYGGGLERLRFKDRKKKKRHINREPLETKNKLHKSEEMIQQPPQVRIIQQPPQVRMIIGNLVNGTKTNSLQWRRRLGNAIKSGNIAIDNCNLPQWLTDFKVLGKDTSSDTSVVLATTKDETLRQGVSLKISYKGGINNSLDIERGFYKVYFDFIQKEFFTPNVVTFFTSFTCPTEEIKKLFTEENNLKELYETRQILNRTVEKFLKMSHNTNLLKFLVIERTQGKTLDDITLTDNEWIYVLFQIIYTFEVFNRLGLRHNDAHLNNIFIDSLNEESPISNAIYAVNKDFIFKVNLKKMVKIFDLDLAGATCNNEHDLNPIYNNLHDLLREQGLCNNTKLSGKNCSRYGWCNDKNIFYDTFLTLGLISEKEDCPQFVIDFIEKHLTPTLLDTEFELTYHLGSPLNNSETRSYVPKESDRVSTPLEMLKDSFFDSLKISINDFEEGCRDIPVYHLPLTKSQDENHWNTIIPESCYQ